MAGTNKIVSRIAIAFGSLSLLATIQASKVTMEPPHCILSSTSSHAPTRCILHKALSFFALLERRAAIVGESDHALCRRNRRAEHAAVGATRRGICLFTFDA